SPPAHAQSTPTLGGSCTTGASAGTITETQTGSTGYLLVCNGTTWVLGAQFDSNGEVGIGQSSPEAALDVNGGVRVGSDTSCSSANAGEIIYTGGNLEYCNGSIWVTLVTSNPGSGTLGGTSG